jgi:hypothetical protein
MRPTLLLALLLAFLTPLTLALSQERVQRKGASDFESTHTALAAAWKAGEYGKSMEIGRDLLALIAEKRAEAILAALPAPPEGWAVDERREAGGKAANPFAGALAAGVGSVIQRRYQKTGGGGSLDVTVTADSPLVQMFQMWAQNPALLGPDAELVKYGPHSAVLKKEGALWTMQLLLAKDLCELRLSGADDEFLLAFFDQKAVDALAAALAK